MISFTDAGMNKQYVFGNFVLCTDGTLVHRERQIHVPPKELAVLTILLETAGELVSKDTLLNHVWADSDVNEESLTRCIYALRRILLESKDCRYIDTVYGKGYRFSHPVVVVSPQVAETPRCSIAVLPFRTHPQLNAVNLHHSLIQALSQYSPFGLTVLPATTTQHCHSLSDIITLIDQLKPDYYLAGQTVPYDNGWKVRVELVRTNHHHLIHSESIELCPDQPISALQNRLTTLLLQCLPELRWNPGKSNDLGSLDTAFLYLNARHEMKRHTPSSLRQALTLLRQGIDLSPDHAQLYVSLAECHLTMSQLGLFDQQQALANARQAANKAVELAPGNPQALGLLALLRCMHSEHAVAKALFKHARLLAPNSTDLCYYHAWSMFLSGELLQAQSSLNECLKRDPAHIPASTLYMWLMYYTSHLDDAIALGKRQLSQYGQDNPILQSTLALLLALQEQHDQAEELIQVVRTSGADTGLIAVNLLYADYCVEGKSALPKLQAFLSNIDCRHVRASLLPLILVAHGQNAALEFWRQLQDDDYLWIKVFRHDPRLSQLAKEIDCPHPEVA
ncbi:TPA: HilA/EilA family virulence transcriptional regulator [Enterobacter hormaechei]